MGNCNNKTAYVILQKLQSDLEALQNEHARVKEKHDAAKTRNQVLSKELKSIKTQIATLIEKGKHDDDLVAALMVSSVLIFSLMLRTVIYCSLDHLFVVQTFDQSINEGQESRN